MQSIKWCLPAEAETGARREKRQIQFGGAGGSRTRDLLTASQTCSQLHHSPIQAIPSGDIPIECTRAPEHQFKRKVQSVKRKTTVQNLKLFLSYAYF